ncbi:hypothetical protein EKO29_15445 [Colwellia sp. Arc7-635]|uniref:hypothetical protein n=1 Tax=Colwellia sp. Arc7-635 TaxID=2497879 RepID=UPI000F84FB5F|nr:hypothetical protein [Colwellia sp. Arc7-635]AZQ85245.1 hypothetical protein EKO29_15445 [Colwellia sp. Arc7-635]
MFPYIKFVIVTSFLNSVEVFGEEVECNQNTDIEFVRNDIFDLSDHDTIFLHEWANFLHIKTKEHTLINESAFFIDKCDISEEEQDELERHLRSKKYIRNTEVSKTDNQIKVETWDNWSLLPTVDLGRKGGKNKYGIGIKDRNLLGLGIDAEIEYFSNDQRTGYKINTKFPLFLHNNINASIRLSDNDDGGSQSIFLTKKFVSFDTKNSFNTDFDNFDQQDTQYENGIESSQYNHEKNKYTASWYWLENNTLNDTLRFGIGYTSEQHLFTYLNNEIPISQTEYFDIPTNRAFHYPFIAVEYLQKDYRKLTNLNLINQIEDFNLGWNATLNIGTDLSNKPTSPTLIWQSHLFKGISVFDDSYWLFDASFQGESYDTPTQKDRFLFSISGEYFHKFNNNWGGYFKNITQSSKNQFLDSPLVLGGETGVRGFPLQYQHGEHSTQFTFEARYYPHINIYKLLELGGAAFIDTGRVFGQSELSKTQSPWMTSVGLGARLYSTHSSEARVIHLDIIKPITSDLNVNNIEFRITTKHSF